MVVVAAATGGLYYLDGQSATVVASSRLAVSRTYQMERAFESMNSTLELAESRQRAYLLVGNPRYLAGAEGVRAEVARDLDNLRRLTVQNPQHQHCVEQLTDLSARKVAEIEHVAALLSSGQREAALRRMQDGSAEALTEQIRTVSQDARRTELEMLAARQQAFDAALARRRWMRRLLMGTSLVGAVTALYLIRRLQRLETFATMCAWSRTVELDGQWVTFEEYLSRRFNVKVSHGIAPREMAALLTQIEDAGLDRRQRPGVPPLDVDRGGDEADAAEERPWPAGSLPAPLDASTRGQRA